MVEPVTPEDLEHVIDGTVAALVDVLDADWTAPVRALGWTAEEVLTHLAACLQSYATRLVPVPDVLVGPYPYRTEAGSAELPWRADPDLLAPALARIVTSNGHFLGAVARLARPEFRSRHVYGDTDAEGFLAMGIVETVVHHHDVADTLGARWDPPVTACRKAVARLFVDVPGGHDARTTMLWACNRADLPGVAPRGSEWRWWSAPPDER